jgi:intraflagellar transport protein 80
MNKNGRLEKSVEAHSCAVTAVAWNYEGTSLATAGEDGHLKTWSRTGNIRSKLTQSQYPIYAIQWSPDQQSVLYASGRHVTIKPLVPGGKQIKWKAHDVTVLTVDWNPINNLIITAGEDCRYKVWDQFGRLLFQSQEGEFPFTCIKWCPNGDYFAVGSFDTILLCDKTGWVHSRSSTKSGSLVSLDWTSDGSHLAAGGSNGAVIFGQVVDKRLDWRNFEIQLNEHNQVTVKDIVSDHAVEEELEFGTRVIEMNIGYEHLVVATVASCYVYPLKSLSTPHIFDLKGKLIIQCHAISFFDSLIVDVMIQVVFVNDLLHHIIFTVRVCSIVDCNSSHPPHTMIQGW